MLFFFQFFNLKKINFRLKPDVDATCEFIKYIYTSIDRTYDIPNTVIRACNSLIAMVGNIIFWTVIGSMPDPDLIVEGFDL